MSEKNKERSMNMANKPTPRKDYWAIVFKDIHKELYARLKWEKNIKNALLIGFSIALVAQFVRVGFVPTTSMEPTIPRYGVLILDVRDNATITNGDIVAFNHHTSSVPYIKRVIAQAGDALMVENGRIKVNGVFIDEPYLKDGSKTLLDFETFIVPDGKLYVLGDNRNNSYDSRFYGYIDTASVVGRSVWNVAELFN